jgi:hypothetical protein
MTNETIKVLLMLALLGVLEVALYQPRMHFARSARARRNPPGIEGRRQPDMG